MGSKYPPGFYDDETVAAMALAFREIWRTVTADDPFRDFGEDEALRQSITRAMMELAAEGVTDVDALRDRTLAMVAVHDTPKRPARSPRRRPAKGGHLHAKGQRRARLAQ